MSSQVLLGFAGITGVGSVIGVPVALHFKGRSEELTKNHQGGGNSQISISIDKCDNTSGEGEMIPFGTQTKDKVCWSIDKSAGSSPEVVLESGKFNQLFQNMWGQPQNEWKMYSDYWRADCPNNGNQWIFTDKVGGKGFLGICEVLINESAEETNNIPKNSGITTEWLSVDKKNENDIVVKVCQGECFDTKYPGQWKVWNETKEKGPWSSIKFHKKLEK